VVTVFRIQSKVPVKSVLGLGTVLAVSTAALAGCGQSASAQSTSRNHKSVSGTLNWYTSEPLKDAQKFKTAFEKKYPQVHVKIFRSGTEQVVSKIMTEHKAGKVQADVVLLADAPTFQIFKDKGMLLSYHSPEDSKLPKQFIDKNYDFVGTKAIVTGIIYNTNLVHQAPTDWSSLYGASAKGQVTMPSPNYSGAAAYNLGVLTRTKGIGWNFYKQLHNNQVVVGKGNGGVVAKVAQGQMKYGMVIGFMAVNAKQKGSPVNFVYPKSGCPVITEPVGIMKNTHNKPAAEAFENFLLSAQGQKMAVQMGYVPLRKGIAPPKGLKSISGFKALSVSTKTLADNRTQDKKKFATIMQ
jgi:iron(III) transport system substrate-binding protein